MKILNLHSVEGLNMSWWLLTSKYICHCDVALLQPHGLPFAQQPVDGAAWHWRLLMVGVGRKRWWWVVLAVVVVVVACRSDHQWHGNSCVDRQHGWPVSVINGSAISNTVVAVQNPWPAHHRFYHTCTFLIKTILLITHLIVSIHSSMDITHAISISISIHP